MASRLVAPPPVGESPGAFECKLTQMFQLQDKEGRKVDSWFVMGEVVAVHVAKSLLRDGVYDTAEAQPILRGDYFGITPKQHFFMPRPR